MDKETGGAAYPSRGGMMFYVPAENKADIEQAVTSLDQEHFGMTLRDYFAAKAMAALIGLESKDYQNRGAKAVPLMAKFAYEYADAMLAERSKP